MQFDLRPGSLAVSPRPQGGTNEAAGVHTWSRCCVVTCDSSSHRALDDTGLEPAVTTALAHRVPIVTSWREATDLGGLLSYGHSFSETLRRAVGTVDKILKGAKPADLPMEQPIKFELIVNLNTRASSA